jgi:hypothetical protein
MARTKKEINPDETKEEKFRRVAEPRIQKLRKNFAQVTAMARQPSYGIDTEDVEKIIEYVTEDYNALVTAYRNRLQGTKNKKEVEGVF